MTPAEEYQDAMKHTPETSFERAFMVERHRYDRLLHAFEEQGRIMKDVAHWLRCWFATTPEAQDAFDLWANMLDPPEAVAQADAAEKFSQDCAARKPPTT